VPDQHCPHDHQDALLFLEAVKKKHCDENSIYINLGDEIDGNQISFHEKDPDMPFSPTTELEAAVERIQEYYEIFPKMYVCDSNHGSLVYRRAKYAGIPKQCIKSYQEILGTPGWHWHEDYLLQTHVGDIYVCHGKTSGVGKLAKEMGTYGAIQGHTHSKFNINWFATATWDRFDSFSGCLIDRKSLAFAYGKNHIPKPILGCMIITKYGYPKLIKMVTNENDRWIMELP